MEPKTADEAKPKTADEAKPVLTDDKLIEILIAQRDEHISRLYAING